MEQSTQIESALRGIIQNLHPLESLKDDMMQEAFLCFWRMEQRKPCETLSYYLTGCRYRLQHFKRKWHVKEQPKSRTMRTSRKQELEGKDPQDEFEDVSDDYLIEEICAREEIQLLMGTLTPRQRLIICDLLEGLLNGEIASRRNLCHQTVTKEILKIRKEALKIGIPAPVKPGSTNGSKSTSLPALA